MWGQTALKHTYRAVMEEEPALVTPPACRAVAGQLPDLDLRTFWGLARAHLLNVGIIRPAPTVTAIEINMYLSRPSGAPASVGRISDQDKSDVPRFLNRCVYVVQPTATGSLLQSARPHACECAHCRLSVAEGLPAL